MTRSSIFRKTSSAGDRSNRSFVGSFTAVCDQFIRKIDRKADNHSDQDRQALLRKINLGYQPNDQSKREYACSDARRRPERGGVRTWARPPARLGKVAGAHLRSPGKLIAQPRSNALARPKSIPYNAAAFRLNFSSQACPGSSVGRAAD